MGVDKVENEDLIKVGINNFERNVSQAQILQYGWPEDVWFHVDKLSSAHVYLRLTPGMTIDSIPEALVGYEELRIYQQKFCSLKIVVNWLSRIQLKDAN